MWECSESEPLTKEAGFWTFERPQEPANPLGACQSMFCAVSLFNSAAAVSVSLTWFEMCPAAHICCQLFCFYLSVFQTFVNITLCPHVGSFKTKELRSIINSANLPKQCNLRAFVAILILSQNTRFPRLRAAQISCLQAPRRILGPGFAAPILTFTKQKASFVGQRSSEWHSLWMF